jgi:CheY-like chemotaxis protein
MRGPVIAIVDDDDLLVRLLHHALGAEGYETVALRSRREAEAELLKYRPSLILLDLWLEGREDGWRLVQWLRQDPGTMAIPLIVCSADREALLERSVQLAAWGYPVIEKPFDLETLLRTIQTLLQAKRPEHTA